MISVETIFLLNPPRLEYPSKPLLGGLGVLFENCSNDKTSRARSIATFRKITITKPTGAADQWAQSLKNTRAHWPSSAHNNNNNLTLLNSEIKAQGISVHHVLYIYCIGIMYMIYDDETRKLAVSVLFFIALVHTFVYDRTLSPAAFTHTFYILYMYAALYHKDIRVQKRF